MLGIGRKIVYIADGAGEGDGVPAEDVAGQPRLLIRVLKEEVARRAEHDAPRVVERVGLDWVVLEIHQHDGGLLRPEGVG